jgi:hypothetical protein
VTSLDRERAAREDPLAAIKSELVANQKFALTYQEDPSIVIHSLYHIISYQYDDDDDDDE